MAIDFPGSPANGDTFTSGTTTWTWDGQKWEPSPAGTWVEAPSDNQVYGRRNKAWTSYVLQQDAPNDGQFYRRTVVGGQMTWAADPITNDAPAAAGQYYGRVNAGWGALSPTFTLKTYVDSQDTAITNAANSRMDGMAVPIGGVIMYGSPTAPANFLNCDGTVYNITSVPKLAAIIGNRYGGDGSTTIAVPNMGGRLPCSTTIGAAGGAGSFAIAVGNLPPHQHLVPAHTHTFSDPGHNHSQSGHAHGLSDPGHAHSYNQWTTGGGIAVNGAATYYQQNSAQTTGASGTGITMAAAVANINAAGTGASVVSNGPWATDASWGQGSGAAISLYPPYMGFNFIIRYN
jgi:microcystin-dependent protein